MAALIERPVCFGCYHKCNSVPAGRSACFPGCDCQVECKHMGEAVKIDTVKNKDPNLCPKCGHRLEKRSGKYGEFLGCVGYPVCRYTRNPGIDAVEIKDNPPEPQPYPNPSCLGTKNSCPCLETTCDSRELCYCLSEIRKAVAYRVSGQDDSAKIPEITVTLDALRFLLRYAFPEAEILTGAKGRPFRILVCNGKPVGLYMSGVDSPDGEVVLRVDGRFRFKYHGAALDVHGRDELQWAVLK